MPLIAKQSLKKREEVKDETLHQKPSCKVRHGLCRKTSLIILSQKMKKGRKNNPSEDDKTTWLSANGQTIAVEKKHIKNFGMDMDNFFKTSDPDQCPDDRSSLETIALDMMSASEVQPTTPNLGKELVNPIGKRVLEIAKNSPRKPKEYSRRRVEKHNCGKKSNKSCFKTTKKSFPKKPAAKREHDDVTLCESENITPRNDISSDPENNGMHCMADGLSSENESANYLSEEAYFIEKEKITLDDFILGSNYTCKFNLNLGNEETKSSEEETIASVDETIPSVDETRPKDFFLENEEEEISEISNCTASGNELKRPNETPIKENSKPPADTKLKAKVNTDRQPLGRPGNVAVVNPTLTKRIPRVMRPGQRLVIPVTSDNGDDDVYPTLQWVIDPPTGDPATSWEVPLNDFIYPSPSDLRRITKDILHASMEDELSRQIKKQNNRISRFCRQRLLKKLNTPRERKTVPWKLTTNLINIWFSILFTALLVYVYYKTYIGRPIPRTLWQNVLLTFGITR
ncbi:uncharacterized protein LOC119547008 isoform X2 [Drosophila subpulchrella]|uniref:uncharacterized protein LOC119547008 isoform X2 n=1 Tax=Drosophila subpulchrella TaxID=1486046 RepID=UPI0018A158E6|nr:uncharacterized protein LOC119547008 isoform X2 [Drosophila subpulchrella]